MKLIVTCAVSGSTSRDEHPSVPYTGEEIADAAFMAYCAGASVIHVHARNPDGTPTADTSVWRDAVDRIRRKCDPVIVVSTRGGMGMSVEERCHCLEAGAQMATLTTGTVNVERDVFFNSRRTMELIASQITSAGMRPLMTVLDASMVGNAVDLARQAKFETPLSFQFILGIPGALDATARNLCHLVDSVPDGSVWSVAGVGTHALRMAAQGIAMGGHVRVGVADSPRLGRGKRPPSNAELVESVIRLASELGREVADTAEARRILGLA